MGNKVGIIYHPDYLKHDTGRHPECSERLLSIMELLTDEGIFKKVDKINPRQASVEEIEEAHDTYYIKEVQALCQRGVGNLDMDTVLSSDSYEVALLAAGGLIKAVDIVLGEYDSAFVLERPPGHHAERNKGMGFCIFNNVAVAAYYAQNAHKLKRILIIDWDLHHGNGTQNIFYEDNSVLYFSTHQYPWYPGTGSIRETGIREGEGYTVNIPLSSSCGDSDYEYTFEEILVPVAKQFKPELIIISAGFDAHYADPLGGMNLSTSGFANFTKIIKELAKKYCQDKIVVALEGGYNLKALSYSVLSVINVLGNLGMEIKDPFTVPSEELSEETKKRVLDIKKNLKKYWEF